MVKSGRTQIRELAWTVAGASLGSLVRYWVGRIWRSMEYALVPTLVLTTAAAVFIGFAFVAPIRATMKAFLIAVGGAAASISAVAAQAASGTPVQSVIGLAAFLVCAVTGVLLGMVAACCVLGNAQFE